jgi:phosphate transport system protein
MRHFETVLDELSASLLEMSSIVEAAILNSRMALVRRDASFASKVFEAEELINRKEMEIDDLARQILTLDQPVAKDFRLIASVIKINNNLERMGDEAVNIAMRAKLVIDEPELALPIDISSLATSVTTMVREALDSFVQRDAQMAREVLLFDDKVDEKWDEIRETLLHVIQNNTASAALCMNLAFAAHSLERIADHATNIAEDVIYLVQGIDVRHHAEQERQDRKQHP